MNVTRSLPRRLVRLVPAALLMSSLALAQAVDPAAAREQLKQGFALKQQGKYAEALPHLLESLRLDPQVKTLMNLADAEEHLGKLVDASRHWIQARDKAASAGDDAARGETAKRLSAVEARMPKLTIVLKGITPDKATVKRDAVVLGAISLGVALPSDPGAHVILVEAAGMESRTFDVTLKEGESRTVEVGPGPKVTAAAPVPAATASSSATPSAAPPAPAPPAAQPAPPAPASDASPPGRTQRIAGLVSAGVGVVALGVAGIEFLSANGKHDDALSHCSGNTCDAQAFSLQDDARSAARLGNVFAVVGGLFLVGGGVLVFTAPRGESGASATGAPSTTSAIRATSFVAPTLAPGGGGFSWKGTF